LIGAAIGGGYTLLRVLAIPPSSGRGLALWAALAVFAFSDGVVLHLLSRRLSGALRAPSLALVAMGVSLYAIFAVVRTHRGAQSLRRNERARRAGRAPRRSARRHGHDASRLRPRTRRIALADAGPRASGGEGARFTNAFSTSCWTLPAHGSLFTGLAPSQHGATWATEHLSPDVPTLAERFRSAGWRTGAFSANPWITPEFGFGRGFELFEVGDADRRPLRPWLVALTDRGPWRATAPLFEDAGGLGLASEALRFLSARQDPRPAFVFLNLLEPHPPLRSAARRARPLEAAHATAGTGAGRWTRRALDAIDQDRIEDLSPRFERSARDIEGLRLLYAAEIAYDDMLVGRLVAGLEAAGRLDPTVIAVTSDHGENVGDHAPLDHQLGLWDSLIHVPLIVRAPGFRAGEVNDGLISLADVPRMLLSAAGVPDSSASGAGAEAPREAVFFEYDRSPHLLGLIRDRLKIDPTPWDRDLTGIRTLDKKWIVATDGRNEAYDLAVDPGERQNLAPREAEALRRFPPPPPFETLASQLREEMDRRARARPPVKKTSPPMSEESEEKLRSLGYVR
jgi:arylsulfatase A-like enzyme